MMLATLLLTVCMSLPGRAIYVSSDGGDDSRPLTAVSDSSTPWKSLGRVQRVSLRPGDSVLLKRGDVYHEMLWLYGSGSDTDPIVVGAWGEGPLPIIDGSSELTEWTSEEAGIWIHDWKGSPPALFEGDERLPMALWPSGDPSMMESGTRENVLAGALPGQDLVGSIAVVRSTAYSLAWDTVYAMWDSGVVLSFQARSGTRSLRPGMEFWLTGHRAFLSREDEWIWTGSQVHIMKPSRPEVRTAARKFGLRIVSGENWILQDLEIRRCHGFGVLIKGSGIVLRNLRIREVGQVGIYISEGDDVRIEDCQVQEVASTGIESYATSVRILGGSVTGIQEDPAWPGGAPTTAHGTGITVRGARSEVRGVLLRNLGYNGIKSTGFEAKLVGNLIEQHCLRMQDGGGIYLSGPLASRSQIDSNIIATSPFPAPEAGTYLKAVAGIYLDERSNSCEVRSNRISGGSRGIFLHNAANHAVVGNHVSGFTAHGISMEEDAAARDSLRDNLIEFNRIEGGGISMIRLKKATSESSPGRIDNNSFGASRIEAKFSRDDLVRNRWGLIDWETWSTEGFDLSSHFD